MERKALVVMNHELTEDQINDLKRTYGVEKIMYLPQDLKNLISQVPPELEEIKYYIRPILEYLDENLDVGDLIVLQGESGVTYLIANYAYQCGFVPVYSTTKREVVEEKLDNGKVHITRTFKHVRFRRYGV